MGAAEPNLEAFFEDKKPPRNTLVPVGESRLPSSPSLQSSEFPPLIISPHQPSFFFFI